MELAFIIWAVGTLPSIAEGFIVFGAIGTIIAGFGKAISACCGVDRKNKNESSSDYMISNLSHNALFVFIPLWIIGAIIPDKDTSYQMLAAYGVQTIVQNETTQELASDGVDVLKALMKKAKKELDVETVEK